jgi:hypothetical protein
MEISRSHSLSLVPSISEFASSTTALKVAISNWHSARPDLKTSLPPLFAKAMLSVAWLSTTEIRAEAATLPSGGWNISRSGSESES